MRHGYGSKIKKALLVGYFGYGNAGDEETLRCAVGLLSEYGIDSLVAFNPKGERAELSSIGAEGFNRFSYSEMRRAARECDAVVFAGGSLFQNETSLRSLLYYSAVTAIAEREKRPIYLLSSGIGEIKGRLGREFTERALSRISFAGMRTDADLYEGRRFFTCPSCNMPDMTLIREGVCEKKRDEIAIIPRSDTEGLRRDVRAIVAEGLTPVIIPFFHGEDIGAAYSLGGALGCEVFVSQNTSDIIGRLSSCRAVYTERLHGAVFSLIASTPFFVPSGDQKCKRFVREIKKRAEKLNTLSPILSRERISELRRDGEGCDFESLRRGLRYDIRLSLERVLSV